jgi:hypothetical protein
MRPSGMLIALGLMLALAPVGEQRTHAQPAEKQPEKKNSLTGVWKGTYTNHTNGLSGGAYLDVTEHPDGTITGKWGSDAESANKIERGERVTAQVLHWEMESKEEGKPVYRVRATQKDKALVLDITVTWREDGKVKGATATSVLTRE